MICYVQSFRLLRKENISKVLVDIAHEYHSVYSCLSKELRNTETHYWFWLVFSWDLMITRYRGTPASSLIKPGSEFLSVFEHLWASLFHLGSLSPYISCCWISHLFDYWNKQHWTTWKYDWGKSISASTRNDFSVLITWEKKVITSRVNMLLVECFIWGELWLHYVICQVANHLETL